MPVQDTLYENCDGDFVSHGGEVASQALVGFRKCCCFGKLTLHHDAPRCPLMPPDAPPCTTIKSALSSCCRVNALCSLLISADLC